MNVTSENHQDLTDLDQLLSTESNNHYNQVLEHILNRLNELVISHTSGDNIEIDRYLAKCIDLLNKQSLTPSLSNKEVIADQIENKDVFVILGKIKCLLEEEKSKWCSIFSTQFKPIYKDMLLSNQKLQLERRKSVVTADINTLTSLSHEKLKHCLMLVHKRRGMLREEFHLQMKNEMNRYFNPSGHSLYYEKLFNIQEGKNIQYKDTSADNIDELDPQMDSTTTNIIKKIADCSHFKQLINGINDLFKLSSNVLKGDQSKLDHIYTTYHWAYKELTLDINTIIEAIFMLDTPIYRNDNIISEFNKKHNLTISYSGQYPILYLLTFDGSSFKDDLTLMLENSNPLYSKSINTLYMDIKEMAELYRIFTEKVDLNELILSLLKKHLTLNINKVLAENSVYMQTIVHIVFLTIEFLIQLYHFNTTFLMDTMNHSNAVLLFVYDIIKNVLKSIIHSCLLDYRRALEKNIAQRENTVTHANSKTCNKLTEELYNYNMTCIRLSSCMNLMLAVIRYLFLDKNSHYTSYYMSTTQKYNMRLNTINFDVACLYNKDYYYTKIEEETVGLVQLSIESAVKVYELLIVNRLIIAIKSLIRPGQHLFGSGNRTNLKQILPLTLSSDLLTDEDIYYLHLHKINCTVEISKEYLPIREILILVASHSLRVKFYLMYFQMEEIENEWKEVIDVLYTFICQVFQVEISDIYTTIKNTPLDTITSTELNKYEKQITQESPNNTEYSINFNKINVNTSTNENKLFISLLHVAFNIFTNTIKVMMLINQIISQSICSDKCSVWLSNHIKTLANTHITIKANKLINLYISSFLSISFNTICKEQPLQSYCSELSNHLNVPNQIDITSSVAISTLCKYLEIELAQLAPFISMLYSLNYKSTRRDSGTITNSTDVKYPARWRYFDVLKIEESTGLDIKVKRKNLFNKSTNRHSLVTTDGLFKSQLANETDNKKIKGLNNASFCYKQHVADSKNKCYSYIKGMMLTKAKKLKVVDKSIIYIKNTKDRSIAICVVLSIFNGFISNLFRQERISATGAITVKRDIQLIMTLFHNFIKGIDNGNEKYVTIGTNTQTDTWAKVTGWYYDKEIILTLIEILRKIENIFLLSEDSILSYVNSTDILHILPEYLLKSLIELRYNDSNV